MGRVGSRLARLEERNAVVRARRPVRDEHAEEDEAVMAKMLETPEGRKVVEDMATMLAEARERITPADHHPKAEIAVLKAAQRINPNYVDIVSRYTDYYFAAREGREPHRLWRFEQKPPKSEHLRQPEEQLGGPGEGRHSTTLATQQEGHKGEVSQPTEISRVTASGVEPPMKTRSSVGKSGLDLCPGPESSKE